MNTCVILPFDGSPVCQAGLRCTAAYLTRVATLSPTIVLAVPGLDEDDRAERLAQARAMVGDGPALRVELLRLGEERDYLALLLACHPQATFVVPVYPVATPAWYSAVASARTDRVHPSLVLLIDRAEMCRSAVEENDGRSRLGRIIGGLFRARPRLHPSVRPHVGTAR